MLFLPKEGIPSIALLIDGFNSNLLLEFTSFSGNKCYSEVILEKLYKHYPFFKDALSIFIQNNAKIAIVIIGSGYSPENDRLKYIELHKDIILKEIALLEDSVVLFPMGKTALYAVSVSKDILKQAGKQRNLSLKKDKINKKYRVIPNYAITYLKYNSSVTSNFYNIFNNAYNRIHNIERKNVETTVIPEKEVGEFAYEIIKNKDIEHLYFDIETEDLTMSPVLCVSADWDTNKSNPICIPVYNANTKIILRQLLLNKPVIGHKFQFDIARLVNYGIVGFEDVTVKADTLILSHLIYNKTLGGLSLKHICKTIFGNTTKWDDELEEYKKKNNITNYGDIPKPMLYSYAGVDAYFTKLLYNKLLTYKSKINKSKELMDNLVELGIVFARWELQGIKIDEELLEVVHGMIKPSIINSYETILQIPEIKLFEKKEGKKLNINSSKQLSEVATEYLFMKVKAKTKAGAISFAYDALVNLQTLYTKLYKKSKKKYGSIFTFVEQLLSYKQLIKFDTSYIKTIKKRMNKNNIFAVEYNSVGTLTGRASSFFHTLPRKTELGNNFKRMVIPHNKDWLILTGDFSQAEPRVMSSLSGDPLLIKSYLDNKDLYIYMASEVFSVNYNRVTEEQREIMKVVVLAISYGMGDKALAAKLDIGLKEASSIKKGFYNKFNVLNAWRKHQIAKVRQNRYVETPLGRIIPILTQDTYKIDTVAVNYLIQSVTADICLTSFAKFSNILLRNKMKSFSIGSVHDSIEIETPSEEFIQIMNMMNNYFNIVVWRLFKFLKVPMKIDIEVGSTWGGSLAIEKTDNLTYVLSGLNYDYYKLKTILDKNSAVKSRLLDSTEVVPDKYSIYKDKLALLEVKAQLKFL